ncbi:MAG: glycoside hydrolase family 88 protein [Balneolaceae bacterium]
MRPNNFIPSLLSLFILITLSCSEESAEKMTPEEFSSHVSDIIVDGTEFNFEPALQEFEQDGLYQIDFPSDKKGVYYARTVLEVEGSSDVDYGTYLAVTNQAGAIEVQLNGDVVYSNTSNEDGHFDYIDYNLFEFESLIPVQLTDGIHQLAIKFEPKVGSKNRIRFAFINDENGLRNSTVSLSSPSDLEELEHYGYWWIGPFANSSNDAALMDPELSANELIAQELTSAYGQPIRWDLPKLHLVKGLPGWLTYQNWHYSGGTFLDAMQEVGTHFEDLDYSEYISKHTAFIKENLDDIEQMRNDYALVESPFGHYFRFSLLDDMGMQTVPYVNSLLNELSEDRDKNSFEYELATRVTKHIMEDASRLDDGTFARFTPDTMSVWADDLFMSSIVLLKMYELTAENKYLDEVISQVLSFDQYLIDEPSKLYWHGFFSGSVEHSSTKWGRANGWTIMAKIEVLQTMPDDHPLRAEVLKTFTRHCEGLLAVQSKDGRWHQVLDDPSSYLETSATAMFVRGFATGMSEGWLDKATYEEAMERGWASLTRQYDEEGNVIGIVRGTPIMFSDEEYDNWGTRINDPRGLGALLYAAIAVDQFRIGEM